MLPQHSEFARDRKKTLIVRVKWLLPRLSGILPHSAPVSCPAAATNYFADATVDSGEAEQARMQRRNRGFYSAIDRAITQDSKPPSAVRQCVPIC
jgi:hypothetical protein